MDKKRFFKKARHYFSVFINILFDFISIFIPILWKIILRVGRIELAMLAIHLCTISSDSAFPTNPIIITTILLSAIFSWDIWIYIQ